MSEINRKIYQAQIEKKRIRDKLELGVDDSDPFENIFEKFTDMEKIVFIHLEYRLSPGFTQRNLGITRQRYSQIMQRIRKKIREGSKNE